MGTVGAQFLSLLWWCLMWQSLRGSQKQMPMCPEQRTHPAEGSLSDRCNWEGDSLEVANFSQQKCRTAKRPRFRWRTCEEVRGRVQISIPQTVWILHRVHRAGARSCHVLSKTGCKEFWGVCVLLWAILCHCDGWPWLSTWEHLESPRRQVWRMGGEGTSRKD